MLSTKDRAKLRSYANQMETILQIGKEGVTKNVLKQIDDALTAREMIKVRVLETSLLSAKDAATEISAQITCEVIQCIGTRVVLYRAFDKDPIYPLK
jgi:RNA-binding protein